MRDTHLKENELRNEEFTDGVNRRTIGDCLHTKDFINSSNFCTHRIGRDVVNVLIDCLVINIMLLNFSCEICLLKPCMLKKNISFSMNGTT